ncbi:hypothetical protein EKH55_3325 [Sinorhizobium alkalisoli]|nr:hypothetical protein EKH55_3325 [Sinorhizobium alkalisoli]
MHRSVGIVFAHEKLPVGPADPRRCGPTRAWLLGAYVSRLATIANAPLPSSPPWLRLPAGPSEFPLQFWIFRVPPDMERLL